MLSRGLSPLPYLRRRWPTHEEVLLAFAQQRSLQYGPAFLRPYLLSLGKNMYVFPQWLHVAHVGAYRSMCSAVLPNPLKYPPARSVAACRTLSSLLPPTVRDKALSDLRRALRSSSSSRHACARRSALSLSMTLGM